MLMTVNEQKAKCWYFAWCTVNLYIYFHDIWQTSVG